MNYDRTSHCTNTTLCEQNISTQITSTSTVTITVPAAVPSTVPRSKSNPSSKGRSCRPWYGHNRPYWSPYRPNSQVKAPKAQISIHNFISTTSSTSKPSHKPQEIYLLVHLWFNSFCTNHPRYVSPLSHQLLFAKIVSIMF